MKEIILFLILFLANNVCSQSAPAPTDNYANNIVLQGPNNYVLYWNYTNTDVLIEVHVKTNGWAGFGLSPNGGMNGSNVVVFWIDSHGKLNFTDRHIIDRNVLINRAQNWHPILVTSKNGFLVAKFTRKIKICDKTYQDLDIPEGTPFFIFAYGNTFVNGDIAYHDFRGSKTLPLISALNSRVDIDMNTVQTADFRVNVTIDPRYQTIYYGQVFKLPNNWIQVKQHLIQYETLYTNQTRTHFHHWDVFQCSPEFESVYLKNNPFPEPGNCVEDENKLDGCSEVKSYCGTAFMDWSVGSSEIQQFPQDIAFPIEGFKYVFLEIHYDNPNRILNLHDNSGVRMYVTTNYRKIELDIFAMYSVENYTSLIVPPEADSFGIDYMCHKKCTNGLFDEAHDEINIIAVLPHSHLTGREMIITQVRDNKEIGYVLNNRNYDFSYQYVNFLSNPIKFKKGDELKLTCVYNTSTKSNFTYGGYGTRDEMCDVFIWYYPKLTNMSICTQRIDQPNLSKFFDQLVKDGELAPVDMSNAHLVYLNALKANSSGLVQKFRDFYAKSERIEACDADNGFQTYNVQPSNVIPMDEPVCQTDTNFYYLSSNTPPPLQ